MTATATLADPSSLPMAPGVYVIRYRDKAYVGSSSCIRRRIRQHVSRIRRGVHANPKLSCAVRKYGAELFTVDVVYRASVVDCVTPLHERLRRAEQRAMDATQPSLNILPRAHTWAGGKHTEKTRRRLREVALSRTDEHRRNLVDGMSRRGDEWRASLRAAWAGKSREIASVDDDGNEIDRWPSQSEFVRATGASKGNTSRALRTGTRVRGHRLIYVDTEQKSTLSP